MRMPGPSAWFGIDTDVIQDLPCLRTLGNEGDGTDLPSARRTHLRVQDALQRACNGNPSFYNIGYMDVTNRIVLDTSVLVAAARSRQGASFALVSSLPNPQFQICLSVAVYTEWQSVLSRPEHLPPGATAQAALGFIRYLAPLAHHGCPAHGGARG